MVKRNPKRQVREASDNGVTTTEQETSRRGGKRHNSDSAARVSLTLSSPSEADQDETRELCEEDEVADEEIDGNQIGDTEGIVYQVKDILGKGEDDDGQIMYHVRWAGFPISQATWENLDNLEGCKDKIEIFEEKLQGPSGSNGANKPSSPKGKSPTRKVDKRSSGPREKIKISRRVKSPRKRLADVEYVSREDDEYEIERIVDTMSVGDVDQRRWWLVKWRNYEDKYNTWIADSDMHGRSLANKFISQRKSDEDFYARALLEVSDGRNKKFTLTHADVTKTYTIEVASKIPVLCERLLKFVNTN